MHEESEITIRGFHGGTCEGGEDHKECDGDDGLTRSERERFGHLGWLDSVSLVTLILRGIHNDLVEQIYGFWSWSDPLGVATLKPTKFN